MNFHLIMYIIIFYCDIILICSKSIDYLRIYIKINFKLIGCDKVIKKRNRTLFIFLLLNFICLFQVGCTSSVADANPYIEAKANTTAKPTFDPTTPVGIHGQLSLKDISIKDEKGKPFQLRGLSTHGLQWYPGYVNETSFKAFRDKWGINVIRLAMYTDDNSLYPLKKEELKSLVRKGVAIATDLGLYVIVDWHILADGNPNMHKDEALRFFKEISSEYKNYPNILYEICNEPNGDDVTWDKDIKPYAEKVISTIRPIDEDAIIIVGTPTWSQDIHVAAKNPLKGDNIMYALHFYANTHQDALRKRLEECITTYKLPIFVTEFGTCNASAMGGYNPEQTDKWIALLNKYNISWINWSISDKDETTSIFKISTSTSGNWSDKDLTDDGKYIKSKLLESNKE